MLGALLETLEERERLIVRLYYQDELTQAEIGRRLGYSQMYISRLLQRAIERLLLAAPAGRRGASGNRRLSARTAHLRLSAAHVRSVGSRCCAG